LTAAETTYADVTAKFAKAITLQQYLYFDYRDAIHINTDGDEHALETKDARAIFPQYDEIRINLRENVNLLARNVERDLNWHSDLRRREGDLRHRPGKPHRARLLQFPMRGRRPDAGSPSGQNAGRIAADRGNAE
jgi:hypothetical protein